MRHALVRPAIAEASSSGEHVRGFARVLPPQVTQEEAVHLLVRTLQLTSREAQVALLMLITPDDAAIAMALSISLATARHHLAAVRTKTRTHSCRQAAAAVTAALWCGRRPS
jgi:DNA-binding CsgD family transcriptional regulator